MDEEFDIMFPKTTRNTMKQYVETLQQHLELAFEITREHIEKEVGRRKLSYDRRVHCIPSFMKSPLRVPHILVKLLTLEHQHKVSLLPLILTKFLNHLTSLVQVTHLH